MLTEGLAALAAAGGTALVGAMATDAWQSARDGFARLLGRGGSEEVIAGQIEADAGVVERAEAAEREQAREDLARTWQRRMTDFLREHPESEQELRELIGQVRAELPKGQQAAAQNYFQVHAGRDANTAGGDMTITHHHGGTSAS
ncbi:hypothetical protein ACFU5O_01715 [Streptomyces sp. NPDC057445]|uniref:hypothetical protein n=1 Tax=Streptomyces sp. NPDC057445 TaxID=3346136 RepID=UPI00369727F2